MGRIATYQANVAVAAMIATTRMVLRAFTPAMLGKYYNRRKAEVSMTGEVREKRQNNRYEDQQNDDPFEHFHPAS